MKVQKKVGILTFQNTLNYGAHLQAFALCSFLRSMGYQCEIINYHCASITRAHDMKLKNFNGSLKGILQFFINAPVMRRRKRRFDRFLGKYLSREVYTTDTKDELKDLYDVFIVGSDQVWNFELTGRDTAFFFDFAPEKKLISYAASMGVSRLCEQNAKIMREYLAKFDRISVRECDAVKILMSVGVENVVQMIDPTFLIEKKNWIKIAERSTTYRNLKNYILVYAQGRPVYGLDFAKKIAKDEGLKVVVVHGYARKYIGVNNIKDASLEDFLWLILHANHVITTSFHGMALSIIFEKSLYYEEKHSADNANSRIMSLAKLFGLEERKIEDENMRQDLNNIDYTRIRGIIKRERNKAEGFLRL